MRKPTAALLFVLLLASCALILAADDYRVILKDGSWLRAREKPEVDGRKARIRLASGQLTILPADRIDWAETEEFNSKPAELPRGEAPARATPTRQLSGPVTIVGETDGSTASADAVLSASEDDGAAEAGSPTDARRERVFAIENEVRRLRTEQRELESRASNSVDLEQAADFREQADALEQRIQNLRAEQNGLVRQLDTASRAGQLPPPGQDEATEDPNRRMRERIRVIEREVTNLRQQKTDLERRAANAVQLEEARRLREQAANLDRRIQTLRSEQNGLILQLSGRGRQ